MCFDILFQSQYVKSPYLAHWGREHVNIGSDNGLSPIWHQAII